MVSYFSADIFPPEVWSQIIFSIPSTDKKFRETLQSVSLTCSLLHRESKRRMLSNIRVECGISKHHHEAEGSGGLSGGCGAVYQEENILSGEVLQSPEDRDLIQTITICYQVGVFAPRGRTAVKQIIDHLVGYRRVQPHAQSKSFEDVNVVFVGQKYVDWGILSDFSYGLLDTQGITIIWELLEMSIHHYDSLWFHFVQPDSHDLPIPDGRSLDASKLPSAPVHSLYITPEALRDLPVALQAVKGYLRVLHITVTCMTRPDVVMFAEGAILALAGLSSLAIKIIEDHDESSYAFPDGSMVYHIRLLIHILNSFPVDNTLQELAVTIIWDVAYSWDIIGRFCKRLEAVAAQLAQVLRRDSFKGVQLMVKVRLQPCNSTAGLADHVDAGDRRDWEVTARNVAFDKHRIRIPSFAFRPAREQVDRSFEVMRSLLAESSHQMSWDLVSTEMSAHCEWEWMSRIRDEIRDIERKRYRVERKRSQEQRT
jgi:hypothetical protein